MITLSRLKGRIPAFGKASLPNSAGGRQKKRLAIALGLLSVILTIALVFDDSFFLFFHAVLKAFSKTWQRIDALTPWQKFLLFAPALLLDTTRYYITNTLVLFLRFFKDTDYEKAPELFDDPKNAPLVSLLVPVYNQEHMTRHVLDTILESRYPNLEIIVIDDGSTDGTASICEDYAQQGKIRFIHQKVNGGKPAALNAAFKLSKGQFILHMDGDTIIWQDAIAQLVKPFRDPRVGAVSGNIRILNDWESFWTGFQALEYGMTISVHRRFLDFANLLEIVSGAFGAYRRDILDAVLGADPETGEDLDLTLKARKMGYRIAFAPKAIALTEAPAKIERLWRQRIFWDRCYVRINLRKHGDLFRWKIHRFINFHMMLSDLLFNIILMLLFPLYLLFIFIYFRPLMLFVLLATFIFYQVVNLLQIAIVIALSPKPQRDYQLIFYSPFYFIYSNFLRCCRATAYTLELFHSSLFKVGHLPKKIWKTMPEHWKD